MIRFSDFLQALANLRAQKTRTLLTALGIVFGVGSVIGMLAIGSGAKEESLRFIETLKLSAARGEYAVAKRPKIAEPAANEPQSTKTYMPMARPLIHAGTASCVEMLKLVGTMTQLNPAMNIAMQPRNRFGVCATPSTASP